MVWEALILIIFIVAFIGGLVFLFFILKKRSAIKKQGAARADQDLAQGVRPALTPHEEALRRKKRIKQILFILSTVLVVILGFVLVRYSIEKGYFTPIVRVISGVLFGGILILFAFELKQVEIRNARRIAQGLAVFGILSWYADSYLASQVYHLIPVTLSFGLMVWVTGFTLFLAAYLGAPLGLLGLLGGMISPFLIEGVIFIPFFLLYLFILVLAAIRMGRSFKWGWLKFNALLSAYLWTIACMALYWQPDHSVWYMLFMIALAGCLVLSLSHANLPATSIKEVPTMIYDNTQLLGFTGIYFLSTILLKNTHYAILSWLFLSLLVLGSFTLAYWKQVLYGYLPFLALVSVLSLLFMWPHPEPIAFILLALFFGILFIFSPYFALFRNPNAAYWVFVILLSKIGFYLVAYKQLTTQFYWPILWAGIAVFLLLLGSVFLIGVMKRLVPYHPQRKWIIRLFASNVVIWFCLTVSFFSKILLNF